VISCVWISFSVMCYVCYRYIAEGKRILHPQQLFDELAAVIEGQDERKKIQQGAFGNILQCTQVIRHVQLCVCVFRS